MRGQARNKSAGERKMLKPLRWRRATERGRKGKGAKQRRGGEGILGAREVEQVADCHVGHCRTEQTHLGVCSRCC